MQPGCHLLLGISFSNQHICEITVFSKLSFQSCWDQRLGRRGERGEGGNLPSPSAAQHGENTYLGTPKQGVV